MLLSLRWVPSRDFVEQNITEQHGSFHKKSPPFVNKTLRKGARRRGGFFVILTHSITRLERRGMAWNFHRVERTNGDQKPLRRKRQSKAVASEAKIKLNK
jgi:hypothetical protein